MTIYMMMIVLVVALPAVVVLYMIFGEATVHRGAVILNEFIVTFADVSWRVILGNAMAGWLMIRLWMLD